MDRATRDAVVAALSDSDPAPLPDVASFIRAPEQPVETDITCADGIFVKTIRVRAAGTMLPQHAHTWDHVSLISAGAVAVWADGVFVRNLHAPAAMTIKAGVKHAFKVLLADTVISCIHRIDRTGEIDVAEEHQLT